MLLLDWSGRLLKIGAQSSVLEMGVIFLKSLFLLSLCASVCKAPGAPDIKQLPLRPERFLIPLDSEVVEEMVSISRHVLDCNSAKVDDCLNNRVRSRSLVTALLKQERAKDGFSRVTLQIGFSCLRLGTRPMAAQVSTNEQTALTLVGVLVDERKRIISCGALLPVALPRDISGPFKNQTCTSTATEGQEVEQIKCRDSFRVSTSDSLSELNFSQFYRSLAQPPSTADKATGLITIGFKPVLFNLSSQSASTTTQAGMLVEGLRSHAEFVQSSEREPPAPLDLVILLAFVPALISIIPEVIIFLAVWYRQPESSTVLVAALVPLLILITLVSISLDLAKAGRTVSLVAVQAKVSVTQLRTLESMEPASMETVSQVLLQGKESSSTIPFLCFAIGFEIIDVLVAITTLNLYFKGS